MKKKTDQELEALTPMEREIYQTQLQAAERRKRIRRKYAEAERKELVAVAKKLKETDNALYKRLANSLKPQRAADTKSDDKAKPEQPKPEPHKQENTTQPTAQAAQAPTVQAQPQPRPQPPEKERSRIPGLIRR